MIVAAAAAEFVPVAVYNNVPGKDAEVLKKFNEPTWNNPVMRFLTADESDVIPRKDGVYHGGMVLARMAEALEKAKRPVPAYLKLAVAEFAPKKTETAVFAMYCYWEGEAKLGALDGVITTRIGELDRAEVVEVTFDPAVIEYKKLVEKAKEMDCTHKVFARTDAQAKTAKAVVDEKKVVRSDQEIDAKTQQQYHLAHFPRYHFLPLTAAQATKVNAALANKKAPDEFLSPLQLDLYAKFTKTTEEQGKRVLQLKPDRSPVGVIAYWAKVEETLAK
jgi:peptide methionine sulfoxide reductase MsrA